MAKGQIGILVKGEYDGAAIAKAQKDLDALKKNTQTFSQKMSTMGASLAGIGKTMSMAVTLPIVGLGAAATKMFMDFDSSMTKITSLVGIAANEVDDMKKAVVELSGQTAKSPEELADALFVVTSAGLRGKEALDALSASAKAGAAGLGQTNDIARAVAGAMNAYGASTLDAARATDIIVATARAGNFETSQFAAALGRVLPFAKQAGASLEEVGGAVALLTRTNGDAAQSVTQISALMRAFVVPTEEAKKALGDAGLSASDMRDRIAKDGLAGALTFLDKTLGGNREQLGKLLGSSEAAGAAFQILDADANTLNETFGVVTDSVGMTDDAFNITSESSAFKLQQAMTEVKNSLIDFGAIIAPFVTTVAGGFATVAGAVNALPGPVKAVGVAFAALLAAVGPVLFIFGKALGAFGALAAATTGLQVKFMAAFTSIRATLAGFSIQIKEAMISARTQLGALAAGARASGLIVITSLRAIGTALKGVMASFGPIGLAMVGLTVAFEIFSNRSQEAEARLDAFKNALAQTGTEATVAALELVIGKIRELSLQLGAGEFQTAEETFASLGLSISDVATATIGTDDQFQQLIDTVIAAGEANQLYKSQYENLAAALESERNVFLQANGDLANTEKNANDAKVAAKALGIDVSAMGDNMAGAATQTADLQVEVKKLSDIFTSMDANIAAIRAKDEFVAFIKGMDKALEDNNTKLLGNGKAAQDNRKVVLDALEKGKQDAVAWGEANGATLAQVEARFKKNTETLSAELIKQGFKADDLEKFFGSDYVDAAGVGIQTKITGAFGTLADRLGPVALREMKGVGLDIGNGIALGVAASSPKIDIETRRAVNNAERAARAAAETGSPSKVFARIGEDLAAGLAQGVRTGGDEVRKSLQENFVGWFKETRSKLKQELDAAKSAFDDFSSTVSKSITSVINFGSIAPEYTKEGELVGQSFMQGLADQAKQATTFANRVRELLNLGLGQDALQMVLQAGAVAGTAIADELIAGGETAINETNRLVQSAQDAADAIGLEAAGKFYGAGVTSAQETYNGFKKNFGKGGPARLALMNLMDNLANSMNRTATITVTTVNRIVREYTPDGNRAAGGPVLANKTYLVGEQGPELLLMGSQSGQIIPNHDLPSMSPGLSKSMSAGQTVGAGANYSITVNAGMGTQGAEVGRQIVDALKAYERRNGSVYVSA